MFFIFYFSVNNRLFVNYTDKYPYKYSLLIMAKEKNNLPAENKNENQKPVPKWFYLVLVIIPIIFILLLEGGLRIFNYGKSYAVFTKISKEYPDMLFLNPEITKKYFTTKIAPSVIPDGFKEVKTVNTFRVFVFGESSAAGWPYVPNASFPRQLKRRLELLYPGWNIEVINLGISAICTYTLKDFMPAVLEQKPDLILFYTGHNEYYGALGVGSAESLGRYKLFVDLEMSLEKLKTFQLLQNTIKWGMGLFGSDKSETEKNQNETLMSRMIGDNLIPLNSDVYKKGIEQFKSNMAEMLEQAKKANVPVILGTLTCNLKDHHPFNSVNENGLPPADKIFEKAKSMLAAGNKEEAVKMFYQAKDLDALRFRAPTDINKEIYSLGQKFGFPVADIDAVMNQNSPDNITGASLMVDHLHPNITGYKIIANEFYSVMDKTGNIPKTGKINISYKEQDSILTANFPFTRLDSTVGNMTLWLLIGNYPFVPKGTPNKYIEDFKTKDFIDSVAISMQTREIFWESGHAKVAEWYYDKNDFENFLKEMNTIIEERPFYLDTYKYTINKLMKAKQYNKALALLEKLDKRNSDEFTTKWIGQISLENGNHKKAVEYLEKYLVFSDSDPQVLYNIAGAYYYTGQYEKALNAIRKCINLAPQNRAAISFYNQLKAAMGQN